LRPSAATFKWPSFTRYHHEAEHYTDELQRINEERRPGNSTPPLRLPVRVGGGQGGGTYPRPKDSTPRLGCNRKGDRRG